MKHLTRAVTLLAALAVATPALARPPGMEDEPKPVDSPFTVRLDYTYDDSLSLGRSGHGFELGFGRYLYERSEVYVFYGFNKASRSDQHTAGLAAETTYWMKQDIPLRPTLGAGLGYASAKLADESNEDGFFVRFSAGLKLELHPDAHLAGGVNFYVSPSDIFPSGNSATDTNVTFFLGLRFHY